MLWPPDAKNWLTEKDSDAEKDWRQEEMTEHEMVGWHHQLNGLSLSKLWELVKDREVWCAAVHGVAKSWTWLSNWITTENKKIYCPNLCNPRNRSTPGLPVHHQLPEFTQTHVHWVGDAIPAISSSVVPFSSCPQSLPASESFPMSQLFAWGGQSI